MTKIKNKIFIALMTTLLISFSCQSPSTSNSEVQFPIDNGDHYSNANYTDDLNITAQNKVQFVKSLKTGWNLGNTLDAHNTPDNTASNFNSGVNSEKDWGMPKTTQAMIKKVADAGFRTIRIPITWHNHITNNENFTIDSAWLTRCKEVVDIALNEGLFVIINIHHDNAEDGKEYGFYPDSAGKENATKYVTKIWEQVAPIFKDYNQKLIFETINEPRLTKHPEHEWNFENSCATCKAAMTVINEMNQVAVNTIRAAGGFNEKRLIMVPSYVASPWPAINASQTGFKLPTDSANMLALSVHMYTPYVFAMQSPGETTFTATHKSDLDSHFTALYNNFVSKGTPVIIGEYGATNKNNKEQRNAWVKYYITESYKKGIVSILWDNQNYTIDSTGDDRFTEKYGYLNRTNRTWFDDTFIKAIMDCFTNN